MASTLYSYSCQHSFSVEIVEAAAKTIRGECPTAFDLATVFVTADYLKHLDDFCDILRVDGHIKEVVGCTTKGRIDRNQETESGQGFCLLAISSPGTEFLVKKIQANLVLGGDGHGMESSPSESYKWISLLDPYSIPADVWMQNWNAASPRAVCTGGLANGANEQVTAVFHNGKEIEGGAVVGIKGGTLRMHSIVSQGCKPIGEPLTVTRAEDNVIYALGSQPAYQALENAFQTLSDSEKSTARGNLFAGLATNEYVDEFHAGDFLVRNIIGADPASGAVVIGGIPRVGQTVQYQYRDRHAASGDLAESMQIVAKKIPPILGSLIFSCAGRGKKFFGIGNHDTQMIQGVLGSHPSAGFFCNGEIGPIRSTNCLTGYAASMGFFYDHA